MPKLKAKSQPRKQEPDPLAAPIWSKESEKGLLGCVLLKPDVLDDVLSIVRPDDFFSDSHAVLFRTVETLHASGMTVDLPTLMERLQTGGDLEAAGGADGLYAIMHGEYTTHNAVYYAKTIARYSRQRKAIEIIGDAWHRICEGEDAEQVRARLDQAFLDEDQGRNNEPVAIRDAILEFFREQDANPSALILGYEKLDTLTGGMRPGQFVIVAARPGMGKTTFATNIIMNMVDEGNRILLFSLEMTRQELAQRVIASTGEVSLYDIRAPLKTQQTCKQISQAAGRVSELPFYLDDTPGRSVADMEAIARRMICKHGTACVVIDYLGLIEPDQRERTRYEQVTSISRQLKKMARRLNVPVIVLAQLNRETTNSKDHRPKLSHLRDSGAIEQDADIVLLIHRESEFDDTADKEAAEVIVAKNRSGNTGSVDLCWEGSYNRFREPENYTEWSPSWDGKTESVGDEDES